MINRNIIPYSEAEPPTDREGKDQQKHTAGGQKQVADPPNQWLLHCQQSQHQNKCRTCKYLKHVVVKFNIC